MCVSAKVDSVLRHSPFAVDGGVEFARQAPVNTGCLRFFLAGKDWRDDDANGGYVGWLGWLFFQVFPASTQ